MAPYDKPGENWRLQDPNATLCSLHKSTHHWTRECQELGTPGGHRGRRLPRPNRTPAARGAPPRQARANALVVVNQPAPMAAELPFQQGAHVMNIILGGSASGRGLTRSKKEYVRKVNLVGALAPTPPPSGRASPSPSVPRTQKEFASPMMMHCSSPPSSTIANSPRSSLTAKAPPTYYTSAHLRSLWSQEEDTERAP